MFYQKALFIRKSAMENKLFDYVDCEKAGLAAYYDKRTKSVKVMEALEKADSDLIRIPSANELCSYGKAVELFCEKNNIDVPHNMKPSLWLRETGHYEEFRAFYDQIILKKLDIWLQSIK